MRKITLNDEQLMIIDKFAGIIDRTRLADKLGIARVTFYELLKRDEEVSDRVNRAEAEAIAEVASVCYEKAMKGDIKAINLYLKCIAGWKEIQTHEYTIEDKPKRLDDFYGERDER